MEQTIKGVIPLEKQIQQFATVQSNLTAAIGSDETEELLSKSLFLISSGSNDILSHFLNIGGSTKEDFLQSLSDAYDNHLTARFFLHSILMIRSSWHSFSWISIYIWNSA